MTALQEPSGHVFRVERARGPVWYAKYRMYRPDHPPAHFHARYGEHWAQITLDGSIVLEGRLPARALRLVQSGRGCIRPSWRQTGSWLSALSRWCRSIRCPSIRDMLGVTKATPLDAYVLRTEFSDGTVGDVDCSFLLAVGLGVDLRDPAYFRQVQVDHELRTVVWPNGLDPAPELLYRHLNAGAAVSSAA